MGRITPAVTCMYTIYQSSPWYPFMQLHTVTPPPPPNGPGEGLMDRTTPQYSPIAGFQSHIKSMWDTRTNTAALADMKRPGVVLLLLTSAAAVQYYWQAAVSLPGPAVQKYSAVSRFVCALRCKALLSEECIGFIYDAADDSCRLFSGDCRGPAADSSQPPPGRYLSLSKCPGKQSLPQMGLLFGVAS